jgi:hypothetical protein
MEEVLEFIIDNKSGLHLIGFKKSDLKLYGEYVIVMRDRNCVNQVIQCGFKYNDLSIGRVVNDFLSTRFFNFFSISPNFLGEDISEEVYKKELSLIRLFLNGDINSPSSSHYLNKIGVFNKTLPQDWEERLNVFIKNDKTLYE